MLYLVGKIEILKGKKVPNRDLAQTWHSVSGLEHKHVLELTPPVINGYTHQGWEFNEDLIM